MGQLLVNDKNTSIMMNLLFSAAGVKRERSIKLVDDETYQENVELIKEHCGGDVEISADMPPIHEECGLDFGSNALTADIDWRMQAAMLLQVQKIKAEQDNNGGFISWKKLRQLFESDMEMFQPEPEKRGDWRTDYLFEDSGVYTKFSDSPDQAAMLRAEEKMKETVGNETIWKKLKIDVNRIKQIFGAEGVAVEKPLQLLFRSKAVGHIAIDIGVVRFPRTKEPYFTLWRFRVIVFKSEDAALFLNTKKMGLFCEFKEQRYSMTDEFMAQFEETKKSAVQAKYQDMMDALGI